MADKIKELVRIERTDLQGNVPIAAALTKLDGVNYGMSNAILKASGIKNTNQKVGALSGEEIEEIKKILKNPKDYSIPSWLYNRRKDPKTGDNIHLIGSDVQMSEREDIKRMKEMKSYKGIRHGLGLKVRGQKTKSTGRKGRAVGVKRKEIKIREAKARRKKGKKSEK